MKLPNPWGFHDMDGNVMEWCLDAMVDINSLPGGVDPLVLRGGHKRAARGGSWISYSAFAGSGARTGVAPDERSDEYGFRVALVSTAWF